jgi:hypothetical protein
MISDLSSLTAEEQSFMYRVPALVTVLIAGADSNIEKKELMAATKLVRLRDQMGDEDLMAYYHELSETFEVSIDEVLHAFPGNSASRNKAISVELQQLNDILPKLDQHFATAFYRSLKSFAKRVAEAAGGILGFASVGMEERHWMELDMIRDPGA